MRFLAPSLAVLALAGLASSQTLHVMYNFGSNPGDPLYGYYLGQIAQGPDGALYATTNSGGAHNFGCVFKVTTGGQMTVLHSFSSNPDGAGPQGGLSLGSDGNLYGACFSGGQYGVGTLWKVSPTGSFTLLAPLHPDTGSYPISPPVQAKDGNFYGVTDYVDNFQFGEIYRLSPAGSYTPLYNFKTNTAGVGTMASGLIVASDGNLYGTTFKGGTNYGTVFKSTPTGTATALHVFDGTHGSSSYQIMQGSDGNLYGTCCFGGPSNYGLVYKLTLGGAYTVLHTFAGADGAYPVGGLCQGKDGYLYGTTKVGGSGGRGVIFRIQPSGQNFELVWSRKGDMTEGNYCLQSPFMASDGRLYGATYEGGTKGEGVFYSVDLTTIQASSTSGAVGSTVTLSGLGFTGATGVSFNGVPASAFKVVSDTSITATVPAGASSGRISVSTPNGLLATTAAFTISP